MVDWFALITDPIFEMFIAVIGVVAAPFVAHYLDYIIGLVMMWAFMLLLFHALCRIWLGKKGGESDG